MRLIFNQFLLSLVFLISTSVLAQSVRLDKVIAVVNDEAITYSEYQARFNRARLQNSQLANAPEGVDINILRALVDERLQAQIARQRGVSISASEVDRTIEEMATKNNMTMDQMFSELQSKDISRLEFERSIEEQILIRRLTEVVINSRLAISEQEVDYHLKAHRELYVSDESYELSHLYVSTTGKSDELSQSDEENVQAIASAINQGMDFAKAVEDYSDGENQQGGGYLGWRKEDQLPDIFLQALRQTPIGGVTEVIKSNNGLHLLKIHAKEGDLKIVTQQNLRHILISPRRKELTDAEALKYTQDLITELQQGVEFSKLARLHSDDQTSAKEGGELGWVNPGETAQPFETASLELQIGEISEPVKTQFGYHIIQVEQRRKKDISEDIARRQARNEIFRRKSSEQFKLWFSRAKDAAFIEMVVAE